jgi:hypothetical protein
MTATPAYNSGNTWPRRRLVIRSVISSTLPIGWTWAALTALIPYFWMGHGAGSSAEVLLGTTRATWLSLHVWSSIAMAVLTIAHMVLNRRGVARSYRVVGGVPNKASASHARRGFAWVGAALLIAVSVGGGYWFATIDNSHSPSNSRQTTAEDGSSAVDGFHGGGNGHR